MRMYECHVCSGLCDPGELENGVCFECRSEAKERQEKRGVDNIRAWNRMLQSMCKQQSDGQMVMNYGK